MWHRGWGWGWGNEITIKDTTALPTQKVLKINNFSVLVGLTIKKIRIILLLKHCNVSISFVGVNSYPPPFPHLPPPPAK